MLEFPKTGTGWKDIREEMDRLIEDDIDWRAGRSPLYIFHANDDVAAVGKAAFEKFFHENALGAKRAFHSLRKMEADVVEMGLDLFSGPAGASGFMTSGGSESIFLAVKTARDHFRACKSVAGAQNMVVPESAHPAFDKAGDVMDIAVRRIPLRADFRADTDDMAAAVDAETMLLVGSAPCFPHGLIDPISELAAISERTGTWLHVDACVGGYLAPFVKLLGHDLPDFDFAIDGVDSISADLHKFGFCPKPASTVFFRDAEAMERSKFDSSGWANGRFVTSTLVGTRPGGSVAGAWAVLRYLGREGYLSLAAEMMNLTKQYVEGIEAIDGVKMLTSPDLTILNFTTEKKDIFSVADGLAARGWLPGLIRKPKGIHMMLSMLHSDAISDYLRDLKHAVETATATDTSGRSASY